MFVIKYINNINVYMHSYIVINLLIAFDVESISIRNLSMNRFSLGFLFSGVYNKNLNFKS